MLAVALALALLAPALAEQPSVQLYVRNKPFPGKVRVLGNDLYAPLDDLLTALGCSWELVDGAVVVRQAGQGSNPALTDRLPVVYEGRALEVASGVYQGRLYVSVPELARAVHAEFGYNRELGTADLYAPAAAPPGTSVERPLLEVGTDPSPLELASVSFGLTPYRENPAWMQLRGYAVLRVRPQGPAVEGVTVRVEVLDEGDNVIGRFGERLGRLGPGERMTWQFPVWTNLGQARGIHPRVRLYHLR